MRIVARQILWLHVMWIAIGCGFVAFGVLTPWFDIEVIAGGKLQPLLRPFGLFLVMLGTYALIYARLQWRPRGFAVGVTRRGLILKVRGFRCPKMVRIKWRQIRGARFEPPHAFTRWPGGVEVFLYYRLATGTLLTEGDGIVELEPHTIGLKGPWEQWHPEDVAELICAAASDPAVRETL